MRCGCVLADRRVFSVRQNPPKIQNSIGHDSGRHSLVLKTKIGNFAFYYKIGRHGVGIP